LAPRPVVIRFKPLKFSCNKLLDAKSENARQQKLLPLGSMVDLLSNSCPSETNCSLDGKIMLLLLLARDTAEYKSWFRVAAMLEETGIKTLKKLKPKENTATSNKTSGILAYRSIFEVVFMSGNPLAKIMQFLYIFRLLPVISLLTMALKILFCFLKKNNTGANRGIAAPVFGGNEQL
jgi:hypothetical protein